MVSLVGQTGFFDAQRVGVGDQAVSGLCPHYLLVWDSS